MKPIYEDAGQDLRVEVEERSEHWDMPAMHYHDAYEIYVLEKGARTYIIDDRLVELQEYDVALIRPYEMHSTAGGGFRRRLVLFREAYLNRYFTRKAMEELLGCFDHRKIRVSGAGYLRLMRLLERLEKEPEDFMGFVELMEILKENIPKKETGQVSSGNQTISGIIAYIAQNYLKIESLDEIAEAFFISKHYLCRLFKEKTGVSVIQYIHMRKIQDAREMLETTDASVETIAHSSGFHSSMYFCRTFKNVMGCTPSEYRVRASAI